MPKITIQNMNAVEFSADTKKSLLQNILDEQIDWLHSCGGKGKCTTCKMIIKEGGENLTPKGSVEKNFFALEKLKENERLACQCSFKNKVEQDTKLVICVGNKNKLPHIEYSAC
ncbi:2Fe-2S iron-sulfur cluster-binding protein [Bernardetia sp. Wsw4-3y2]|uniref:2Fe-2S iron-sulfur cluster-binding protein n=1 Tax=Bernardetia sp. Wsw4-3y2 TaxID=3127471 RepID=UPI0030CC81D6